MTHGTRSDIHTPLQYVLIIHEVVNYPAWKKIFDGASSIRKEAGERSYGIVAQQAVEVYPTAVTHTINPADKDDEFWGVDYSKYVPVLLQELKALRARVAQLEGKTDIGVKPQ